MNYIKCGHEMDGGGGGGEGGGGEGGGGGGGIALSPDNVCLFKF